MTARVLVAGVGNLFLGDDGFGPEVVRRLAGTALPPGVLAVDYGIRGIHLAYDMLDGFDALILVDAVPAAADKPGTVTVLKVNDVPDDDFDPHGMNPTAVLSSVQRLGGALPTTFVVGCAAANVDERIGLSEPVGAAVPVAISTIQALLNQLLPLLRGSSGKTEGFDRCFPEVAAKDEVE
jgi:hydrogenase maturation protease